MTGSPAGDTIAAPPALPRPLYAVGLADSIGLGMYLAFSAVYLNLAIGLPNYQIGITLGLSGIASIAGALPLAALAQRMGLRRSLTLYFVARALSYLALALAWNTASAIAAVTVAGLLSRGTGPLIQAVSVHNANRSGAVAALAWLRLVRNAGMAAGSFPAAAAVALADRWALRSAMLLCALMFLICSALSRRLPPTGDIKRPVQGGGVGRNLPFLAVTVVYGLLILSAILLGVGMPLWIVQHTDAPPWAAGFVTFVNTAMVVALQIHMSKGSDRPRRARFMMTAGGLLAAVAAAAAPLSTAEGKWRALAACLLVVVVMTVAELLISAGSMGLALVHTPASRRPVYLATYNLGFAAATVIGPPLVTVGLAAGAWTWPAWAALFVGASIAAACLPLSPRNQT